MTAKEYLRQLWQLDREINIKYQELEHLRASIGIRAMRQGDVVVSGETSDPVADTVTKIISMEEYINRKIDKLIDLRKKITDQIDGMESRTFRNILTCRYVLMQNWSQISETMGYDVRHCTRLHGRALQEFSRLYL
jgi:DNA-directed RNA polymerase specialized sigma subunit